MWELKNSKKGDYWIPPSASPLQHQHQHQHQPQLQLQLQFYSNSNSNFNLNLNLNPSLSAACLACILKKLLKKWRITELAVTSTFGSFRCSKLDTVAGSTRRIFRAKGFVQGRRSKTRRGLAKWKPKTLRAHDPENWLGFTWLDLTWIDLRLRIKLINNATEITKLLVWIHHQWYDSKRATFTFP